tara:strand:+ start:343 stop:591 length:249 start_codon:yes stop_codon:yes gene_type:complete
MNCVEQCKKLNVSCPNTDCRYWINYSKDLNCAFVTVDNYGALTLKETAKRLEISHVRVKQIQDKALKKINKKIKNDHNYNKR